ncbi:hypothetical protein NHX12_001748 [Muraenolepis orangiensis]|uniref:Uncharacterized protein n=1 Tax=Muraenolepis orangiensis TaxID=630683 RepID=A0A9Q0E0C1_9TELE|nr:hypothetical protein NHX12_001748 [Muraenolepis orangiensis]
MFQRVSLRRAFPPGFPPLSPPYTSLLWTPLYRRGFRKHSPVFRCFPEETRVDTARSEQRDPTRAVEVAPVTASTRRRHGRTHRSSPLTVRTGRKWRDHQPWISYSGSARFH